MRVEVRYVNNKWQVIILGSPGTCADRVAGTAEEVELEDAVLRGGRIIGTPKAVWGFEVNENARAPLKTVGVGGRFGKPPASVLMYDSVINAFVDHTTLVTVERTPLLRLKGTSMRYWRQ